MFGKDFPEQLSKMLEAPLPGWKAQRRMIPEGRATQFSAHDLKDASVLLALHQTDAGWVFPLIQRSADGFAHSGQIALPGGRKEAGESDTETALREAWEEVNIIPEEVIVIGKLTPLPIPVSNHLVQPVVGHLLSPPDLIPDQREVAHVFTVKVQDLMALEIITEQRVFKGRTWEIPFLDIYGHKVWGATAMILSEFRALLKRLENAEGG